MPARASSAAPPARRRSTSPTSFEPGSGSSTCWRERASSPPANDLAPAAAGRRARPRPVQAGAAAAAWRGPSGLSGSGPTHWALYPSIDEAATAADRACARRSRTGRVPTPGGRPPFVAAARIARGNHDTGRQAMTRQAISTSSAPGALGPVQPGHRHRRLRLLQRADRHRPGVGRARRRHRGPDRPGAAQPLGRPRRRRRSRSRTS